MTTAVVLLAAGRGERLGADVPKAFVTLAGRPLLGHVLDVIERCSGIDALAVAVPPGWEQRAEELVAGRWTAMFVAGGPTRQSSGAAALTIARDRWNLERVVVHDVARPLASPSLYDAVLRALADVDGAVPGQPVSDTIKRVDDGRVVETLPRPSLVAVQTPQAFDAATLIRAHDAAARDGFQGTDDAVLVERIGGRVVVVPGERENMKITVPEDLAVAGKLLSAA